MDDTRLAKIEGEAARGAYYRALANAMIVELAESLRGERERASQLADAAKEVINANDNRLGPFEDWSIGIVAAIDGLEAALGDDRG